MRKEDFDKAVKIDGWICKEGPTGISKMKQIHQSTYMNSSGNIMMIVCYTYPDKYVAKVIYRDNRGPQDIEFATEDDAYDLLYRLIYEPDSVSLSENGWNLPVINFVDHTEENRKSLLSFLRKNADNNNICLHASWHNFGIISPEILSVAEYTVLYNGDITIIEKYGSEEHSYKTVTKKGRVSFLDMKELQNFEPDETCDQEIEALDGTAWEFVFYDDNGKERYSRPIGYIYSIKKLQKIAHILSSYDERAKIVEDRPKTEEEKIIEAQIQTIKDLNLNIKDEDKYQMVRKSVIDSMAKHGVTPDKFKGIMAAIEKECAK